MIEWSHPELSLNPGHHLPTQRKAKMKTKEAGMARIERDRYQLTGLWRINMKTQLCRQIFSYVDKQIHRQRSKGIKNEEAKCPPTKSNQNLVLWPQTKIMMDNKSVLGMLPQLSGFICNYHPAASGSRLKHTIYTFIIYSHIFATFVI